LYRVFNQINDPEEQIPRMFAIYGWNHVDLCADFFAVISMASRSLVLVHAIYEILDKTMVLAKSLVGQDMMQISKCFL
jgi:hypothetical protein